MACRLALRRGRSRTDALDTAGMLLEQGHGVSVDLFGERVRDPAAADRVAADYLELAGALPPPADVWLSVDLSHLALDADSVAVAERLAAIARALPAGRRVQVGAEEAAQTDAVLACVLDVAARGLADRLGATVQANLVRPTSPFYAWASASPGAAPPGPWPPTTRACARRCSSHTDRCRSSNCSACAPGSRARVAHPRRSDPNLRPLRRRLVPVLAAPPR